MTSPLLDPVIGTDCHIILSHPSVSGGSRQGFLLARDAGIKDGGVQITREVSSESETSTHLWVYFDILCADNAVNPDGSIHYRTRAEDYSLLLEYLQQREGINVEMPMGVMVNMGALGWTADERHQSCFSVIKCQLNNVGVYFPPVDPELLIKSVWSGLLTWESSYWR